MHIRRDYREPFFRERRRGFPWRALLWMGALLAGMAFLVESQPQIISSAAYALLGNAPTPTPLPREWIERAMLAQRSGDYPTALAAYEAAIAQRPNNVDFLYEYGQLLIDAQQPADALRVANTITNTAPGDVRGYALKTRAMAWLGQSAAAIPVALQGMNIDNRFGPLYEAISRAYAGEARWREAIDSARMATELSPSDARAYWALGMVLTQTGNYDMAIAELRTAIQLNPTLLPPYFELAFLLLSLDRNQEAIDLYDRILGMQPRNARALLRQCEAYRKIGEFNRALGLCQDAVDADPTFTPAQYRLGMFRYSQRDFEASRAAFDACLTYAPDSLQCRYMLGLSYYYLRQCDQARQLLTESQRIASARSSAEGDLAIINEGLAALAGDPQCLGGGMPAAPTPTAEPATEDAA
ncbi:MAG: tetratricopeptide repeat protein [Anaerolineae bacterium]